MVDVANKIDNATDTATNSTVESQNKIQEELKETQKVAEQVSEAMNNVGSDKSNISSENITVIEQQIKKQNEYNDLVSVGYDRIKKMKKISESGTTGSNSVYDLLRLNHKAWDEVKANNFFNTIPEEGLQRYTKILEVVEKIVQEMVKASGLTESQIISQLKDIQTAKGGNFKLNGADSGWTHFATYSNGQKDAMQKPNGITYKVYAAFDDIKDLNQNVVSSIMEELTKAGFKGRLKTTSGSTSFGDKLNGLAITDQMVVHGSTKKDQEIAYNVLKNIGVKLSYLGGGIDTPDGSFSQTLASGEINKYIQGLEKEAVAARDAAKAEQQLADSRKESAVKTPIKDVFQGEVEKSGMDTIASATEEAVQSKKDFATANEGVQSSIDGSKSPLQLEAELMDQIAKSAHESADAKKEFVEANKQVKDSVANTNEEKKRENTEENTNAWKELIYSIQRYSEVSKRISSGKALEGDVEEASRLENKISQLQKLDILSPTQIEKSEHMLTKLYDTLDDIEKKSKETTLESLNSSIDKYRNDYNSRSSKPVANNQSDEYKKRLANYKTSIEELEAYRDKISNSPLVSKEDLNQIDKLIKKIKESATAFNSLTASQKGSTPISRGKTIEWANDLLEQNSKWSKKAKNEVQGWIDKLATADPSNVEEIRNRILEIVRAEREAGNAGKTWLDIFSTKKLHNFLGQAASMFSFYDLVNVGREIVTNIKEVDTALTELRKVSDATEQRLTTNFKNSVDTAKELGATVSDVISATADWSRMGYNIDQAEELARVSTLYKNVGDGIDIETANNSLISTLQGFQLDASEAESIIDKFNEVANNYAIDSAGIGEALQRSAASFNAANTDLSKSIALITTTNEVVQDPESVGEYICLPIQ